MVALKGLFPDAVLIPIRRHVDAKRFLCATDESYWPALSEDSRRSLELQGGVYNAGAARRSSLRSRMRRMQCSCGAGTIAPKPRASRPPVSCTILKSPLRAQWQQRRRNALSLPVDITLLVLLAALMHASWNAIAKSGTNKLLDITVMALAGGLMCALALPFLPLPEPESWPCLAASLLLHFFYFMVLVGAYANADLSHAYPLMRGVAPLLVALFGVFLLDDHLTASMWAGIALISAGILLPFWLMAGRTKDLIRSSSFALANAGIIAAYTLVDGFGTRLSAHPLSYCLWLFLLDPLPILAVAVVRHRMGVWRHIKARWLPSVVGGLLTVAAYGIVLWAMTRAPIAAVAALRETSVTICRLDRQRIAARRTRQAAHCRRRAGRVRDRRAQAVAAAACLRAIWRSSIGKFNIAASTPMPIVSSHIKRYEPVASNR